MQDWVQVGHYQAAIEHLEDDNLALQLAQRFAEVDEEVLAADGDDVAQEGTANSPERHAALRMPHTPNLAHEVVERVRCEHRVVVQALERRRHDGGHLFDALVVR